MVARAGGEPTTLQLKAIDSTKAPPCPTFKAHPQTVRVFNLWRCNILPDGEGPIIFFNGRPSNGRKTGKCTFKQWKRILKYWWTLVFTDHGEWWLNGKFDVLRLEDRRFESHSSCHVGTLGKSFTHNWLLHFGELTPTLNQCCSRKRLWVVVDLKRCYRNIWNE